MPFITRSPHAQTPYYRPDIDGLRAVAVLPVVLYHLGLPLFSGGFVGVDIFFVISGFLITTLIAKDLDLNKFSLITFYERRARRILPALFAVLLFCTLASIVMLSMHDLDNFGRSLLASTLFASNFFFERQAQPDGYFASDAYLLLHTWSLSVEEQFYLLFPLIMLVLQRYCRSYIAAILILGAIMSFAHSMWAVAHVPVTAFFHTAPRAWELLLGSILAFPTVPVLKRRASLEITAAAGLGLILWSIFAFHPTTPFPGANALAPCVGAWLIIYCGMSGAGSVVGSILQTRLFVSLGAISYSLYLWHWPILFFCKYWLSRDLNGLESGLVSIISLIAAFLSFHFVEQPFRGSASSWTRSHVFCFSALLSVLFFSFGVSVHLSSGFPQRFDPEVRELIAANTARSKDSQFPFECSNFRRPINSDQDVAYCLLGRDTQDKILVLGDSHLEHLYPVFKRISEQGELGDLSVLFATSAGCLPTEHFSRSDTRYYCRQFTRLVVDRAMKDDVRTIFIGFSLRHFQVDGMYCERVDGRCKSHLPGSKLALGFMSEFSDRVSMLQRHGKRVILALPFPLFDSDIPHLQIHNAMFAPYGLGNAPTEVAGPPIRESLIAIADNAKADVFDPRRSLCQETCIYHEAGVSIYQDKSHIASSKATILHADLLEALR